MVRFCLVAVLALTACEKKSDKSSDAAGLAHLPPTRAAKLGDFPDNPLLQYAPADTPYVLATFKPIPPDYLKKMNDMFGPIWRRAYDAYIAKAGGDEHMAAVMAEIGDFSVARFEELGFSAKARMVVYGIAQWPVARIEINDGDKVIAFAGRVAQRWGNPLPAPTERAGHKYWLVDLPDLSFLVAIAPKELVLAIAPRAHIDQNLALILGEQKPAQSVTGAQLKAIAERDGFTGQGVGYADVAKIAALVLDRNHAPPACSAAFGKLAARVPRIAFGYDDLQAQRVAFGMVVELAPDLTKDARAISGSLPGLDRALDAKGAMTVAVAGDIPKARALAGRGAASVRDLAQPCEAPDLASFADKLDRLATRPAPPFVETIHGFVGVVQKIALGPQGLQQLDAYAAVHLDHADDLVAMLKQELPGFDLATDSQAKPLPPMVPMSGHMAASKDAIAVAVGAVSAGHAVDALAGKAVPAPLMVLQYDYSQLGDLMTFNQSGSDADNMRAMMKAFGVATMQLLADERGFVAWGSFELR